MEQTKALNVSGMQQPTQKMLSLEDEIRKAKAEGRTVSIKGDCLFIDYHLVERLTPRDLDYLYNVLGE